MNPKDQPKHSLGDICQEAEVHLLEGFPTVDCGCEGAKDRDLVGKLGTLGAGEGDEGLPGALGVGNEGEFGEASVVEDVVYKGGEVEDAHVADVPGPHARIVGGEGFVFGVGATAVVSEPDIVATVEG